MYFTTPTQNIGGLYLISTPNVSAIVSELEAACTYGFTHVAGPHVPKQQHGKNSFWDDHFNIGQDNPPHIQNSACDAVF